MTGPVTDWNGDGTVDSRDQWIELATSNGNDDLAILLSNPNTPHTGFGLEFTDVSGAQVFKPFSSVCADSVPCIPKSSITFFGLLMVVQNPGPMAANAIVRLRDLRIINPADPDRRRSHRHGDDDWHTE